MAPRVALPLILVCVVAIGVALLAYVTGITVRFGAVDSAYYPRVLAVAQTASPPEREKLLKLWASQTPGGGYSFITFYELHQVLWHAGYCTNLISWPGCRELPHGSEAQGIAKDLLGELSASYRK
jgi:hypothetical protein